MALESEVHGDFVEGRLGFSSFYFHITDTPTVLMENIRYFGIQVEFIYIHRETFS